MREIHVIGFGVAGSTLSLMLAEAGNLDVKVYDVNDSYSKPCGEVVPLELLNIVSTNGLPAPRILNHINRFILFVYDELVRVVEFENPLWASIEKSEWVRRIRDLAVKRGVRFIRRFVDPGRLKADGLIVDARGPWGSKGVKIPVWRSYVKARWPQNTVAISFSTQPPGLAWVFPHGSVLNIGAGYLGTSVGEAEEIGMKLISRIVEAIGGKGVGSIYRKDYAPITILPEQSFETDGVVKVGEAAGLLLSLGGEGIRPAVISAVELGRAVQSFNVRSLVVKLYESRLKDIVRQVRLQAKLLKWASRMDSRRLSKALRRVNVRLLYKWFKGSLPPTTPLYLAFYVI